MQDEPLRILLDTCSAATSFRDGGDLRLVDDAPLKAIAEYLAAQMGFPGTQRLECYRDGSDESFCTTIAAARGLN
jgi:hypothetical protein